MVRNNPAVNYLTIELGHSGSVNELPGWPAGRQNKKEPAPYSMWRKWTETGSVPRRPEEMARASPCSRSHLAPHSEMTLCEVTVPSTQRTPGPMCSVLKESSQSLSAWSNYGHSLGEGHMSPISLEIFDAIEPDLG